MNQVVVPDLFCLGVIVPILKKGSHRITHSHRQITLSSELFKLFELRITSKIKSKCKNTLNVLTLGHYDVKKPLDSCIHSQILLELYNSGVSTCFIQLLHNLYNRLNVSLKLKIRVTAKLIYVQKVIKQGSLTSPNLFNNTLIITQAVVKPSCIYKVMDVSLICFADDIVNIARISSHLEENFSVLQKIYDNIGLDFNLSKS